jgi:hypothetical protein
VQQHLLSLVMMMVSYELRCVPNCSRSNMKHARGRVLSGQQVMVFV